jgi:hypothetical protein
VSALIILRRETPRFEKKTILADYQFEIFLKKIASRCLDRDKDSRNLDKLWVELRAEYVRLWAMSEEFNRRHN